MGVDWSAVSLEELHAAVMAGEPGAKDALALALLELSRRELDGQGAVAEDLAQVTVMRVLSNPGRFEPRGEGSFRRWVRAIAVNVARDRAREDGRWRPLVGELLASDTSPSAAVLAFEEGRRLESAIGKLTSILARAVRHRRAGGSLRTLAELEGVPPGTARRRMSDAVRRLRELLEAGRKTGRGPESSGAAS